MRHLDLCSGIGGFALAASWVWTEHEILSFVEIDEYCQQVLRKHWPDVPIHDDCNTFDARPFLGRVDILTGGYPCQPFSVAGKREGEKDDRHLWPEVFRITRECRPRWCLFENVTGHVTLGLDSVLSDLEGIGYTCAATVIPACAVDAPHRRDRLWIMAHGERERLEGYTGNGSDSDESGWQYAGSNRPVGEGGVRESVADAEILTERAGLRKGEPGWQWRRRSGDGSGEGFTFWLPEPNVGRVAHGVPARVDRLRALGNSIVPQVAAEIMRAIAA